MLVIFLSVLAIALSGLRYGVHGQITEDQQSSDDYVACSEKLEIEIPPCRVSSGSSINIYCRQGYDRCSLKSLDLSNYFKPNEQKDLEITCSYWDTITVDIVPDFWTLTPSISHLDISTCNMSMFSLMKLLIELKPQSLSLGSGWSQPVTLFPVIHQTENCISHKEFRESVENIDAFKYDADYRPRPISLKNIAEFKYDADYRPIGKTTAIFLKILFNSTPMLESLTLERCNGSEIIDLIETDMPSVTYLELFGPDITPDVIQCVGNRMKGLENIHIHTTINEGTRKRCLTEETPLSNVTNLILDYSGVFRAIDSKLNMPNLQTLSISGLNGSDIVNLINIDMPFMTSLKLDRGADITPDVIQCIGNRMKGLQDIHISSIIYNSTRKECSTEETPLSKVRNLTLQYSGIFRAIDSKLDMPNLQTLSIPGLNGRNIVDFINTDMPSVTHLVLDGPDITPDVIQYVSNRMKGLENIYIQSVIHKKARLNMPNLQTLSISGLNGSEIIDLINTDMPSVTHLELNGPDITPDVIQCVGNTMKGLQNIYANSMIFNSPMKKCLTKPAPLIHVTSLTLHYSGVFQAVYLNFNMPNLKTLNISGVDGSEILHMLQTHLPSVTELYLYEREITPDVIVASAMKGLEHLNIYIIIEKRRYQIVKYQCSNLNDFFRNIKNTSLKMFILSPPYRYWCDVIDLSHNGLQDLGRKTFSKAHYFKRVRYLNASFNNISILYEGCFKGLNNLEELNISWNRITHINPSHFTGLHKLQVLILSHNELKTMGECLSELISFSNELTTLDMSHNYLSSSYSTQCKMTKLERLYLQNNNYSNITEIVESIGFDIKYINLSSNPVGISELAPSPINKKTLEKISNNFFTSDEVIISGDQDNSITLKDIITRPIKVNAKITPWLYFQWLLSKKDISQLRHSPIVVDLFNMSGIYTTIYATEALGAFPVMNHFSFNLGNQIYCGCEYISTYVMLNVLYKSGELTNPYYKNNWTCKGPGEFSGVPLLQAPQRMFKDCPMFTGNTYLDSCCVYYKQIYTNKHTIDCSTCGIKNLRQSPIGEFPFVPLFPDVEVILMSNNQIDDLCQIDTYSHIYMYTDETDVGYHIEVIDFRNNSLESICDDFLKQLNQPGLQSLRKIDLRQNQLTTLSKYVLNNQFNLDFVILLAGNKFLCTCNNIWLKDWTVLQPDEMLPDLKSVKCGNNKINLFVDMTESDLSCNIMWQQVTIGLATSVGILLLITMPLYRMRAKIKIWMFLRFGWHPLDKGDNDNDITHMDYDAFISYSYQDLAWVRGNLLDFLQSDQHGYKVCLHERDWPVGVLITENILLSVKHSRRMIMVLSENYLNSEWCRMEFQAAHREMLEGRTKYLIMIAMEGFPLGQLPPEMDFYIKTHTYLEAESNWFKEKLIYAMPETPLAKIRELRSQTNMDMEMEVRAISRRRFPALFYRMFTYRDGRGNLPQDEEIIIENEEIEDDTRDILILIFYSLHNYSTRALSMAPPSLTIINNHVERSV